MKDCPPTPASWITSTWITYRKSFLQFLAHTITSPQAWQAARQRIDTSSDRIPWDHLRKDYPIWKENGHWIQAQLWFGFDVTHSWMVGAERVLLALLEQPAWMTFHQRAIGWAHAKGIKAHLHSCGDVRPFVPELVGMGLDALNPLEVKAGMDPLALKREYGKDLVLHGGINAVLWDRPDLIRSEMELTIPVLKKAGGYIFSSDHSVPSSISLDDFGRILNLAKELGSYE